MPKRRDPAIAARNAGIVTLFRDDGFEPVKIAELQSCTLNVVRMVLNAAGISLRRPKPRRPRTDTPAARARLGAERKRPEPAKVEPEPLVLLPRDSRRFCAQCQVLRHDGEAEKCASRFCPLKRIET